MADIERWTLRWVAPEVTEAHPNRPNAVVNGPSVRWHGEEVDVVRAADHEGAVEALAELRALLADCVALMDSDEYDEDRTLALQERIRAAAGGRYVCESCGDAEPDGAKLIAAERRRQVDAEGWTPEHDDAHTHYELAKAGAAYALYGGFGKMSVDIRDLVWPWEPESFKPSRDRIRDLAKAGALIAAEIDRLHRLGGQ